MSSPHLGSFSGAMRGEVSTLSLACASYQFPRDIYKYKHPTCFVCQPSRSFSWRASDNVDTVATDIRGCGRSSSLPHGVLS